MNDTRSGLTATVYRLEDRVRLVNKQLRRVAETIAAPSPPVPATTFGGGWYHDAAIRDETPPRKS